MGELSNELARVERLVRSELNVKPGSTLRLSLLTHLIQLSKSYRGLPALESPEAIKTAQTWDTLGLHSIPEEELPEAFKRALEALGEGQLFGAPNIREAWEAMSRERAEARAREQQARSLNYKAEGITFAQWWERDGAWIQANLPPATQAAMREIFEARKAKGILSGPPPAKDTYVSAPPAPDPRYCQKCSRLSGLYWDDLRAKYRCCECDGGRDMARAIWEPRSRESGKRGWSKA